MSRDSRPRSGGSSASRSAYARTIASGVRSSWVTSAMSSLRASSIALSASTRASASDLLAALLDDPGEEVGDRAELRDVGVG